MESIARPTGIPEFLADLWVRYVSTLRRGLRREALSVLDAFIERLESQSVQVRDVDFPPRAGHRLMRPGVSLRADG